MTAFTYLGLLAAITAAFLAVCYIIAALIRLFTAFLDLIFPPKSNP
jgi:hypothetical protein